VNENFDAVEDAVDGNDELIAALEARIEELENDVGVPGPQGDEGQEGPQGEQGPAGAGVSEFRKTVFVTSESFGGNLGGVAGADAKCQNAADVAGLGGEWKAWIAADTVNSTPAARFSVASRGYETMQGEYVGGRLLDIFPEYIMTPINIDENGQSILPSVWIWTGVHSKGYPTAFSCLGWTSNLNAQSGTRGEADGLHSVWTNLGESSCDTLHRLYCFEQ
jgi:hypothetical protein